MKKIFRNMLALVLVLLLTLGAVACNRETIVDGGDGDGNEDVTVVQVMNFGGGVGRKWLDLAAQRFELANVNTEFEPGTGKKGVDIKVESDIHTGYANMAGSGVHIYFEQPSTDISTMVQQGLMLNINDVVKDISDDTREYSERADKKVSIEDKIDKNARSSFKGSDGNYYLLPHYEFYDGLTYDVDLFTKKELYICRPEFCYESNDEENEDVSKFTCTIVGRDFYFTKNKDKMSCGNDGVYGTLDDGLPTTLIEFVALCDYMSSKKSVTPFTVAGGHIDYTNYFTIGLWTALAGYERTKAAFTFNSGTNTVEYVTDVSGTENLFSGFDGIKKPITQTSTVTEVDGYKAYNSVEKYYALAFGELMEKKGWVSNKSTQNTHLHTDAMRDFYLNSIGTNPAIGMIMEGSYWLNEAEDNEIPGEYEILKDTEKNIAWMALPTSFDTPVTVGNGREMAMMNGVNTYAFINGNLATKPNTSGIIAASKAFLKFLYTDAELKNFIAQSGSTKAFIDLEIDSTTLDQLNKAQKSVMEYRTKNRVVQQMDDNATFKGSYQMLTYGIEKGFKTNYGNMAKNYECILTGVRDGKSAWDYFKGLTISETKWASEYYKGAVNG